MIIICAALLLVSWAVAINTNSAAEKQQSLISEAIAMMNDGIYIRAALLLEEAAEYDAAHTIAAENELKRAYLALIGHRGFAGKYIQLLETQMNRREADPDIFIEAAKYYLSISKTQDALAVLRNAIEKTDDSDIRELYENSRYVFEVSRASYENVTAIYNQTIQVQQDGKWGIANASGTIIIPCRYDKISTFSKNQAVAGGAGRVFAIDASNHRIAITHEAVSDFGNFSDNRIALLIDKSWHRATGNLEIGASGFEEIGMYSGGYAAAKTDGKWGVIGLSNDWLIPAQFDGIIMDELGRSYAQDVVFARSNDEAQLIVGGGLPVASYEDAHPFSDEGYAAVMRDGKWGFIDTNGIVIIPFTFDEALSFGQHLAAVKIGDSWGYISMSGQVVIEPQFAEAKSFSGGSAPVLTGRGWQFITLLEYK